MKQLEGRTAFITGAVGGIGFALAEAFLAEGMNVALADRDADMLAAAQIRLGNAERVATSVVDVVDRNQMASARDAIVERFGGVSVLCNNAGVGGGAAIHRAEFEDWDWMLGVNLHGVINGIVTFLPTLRAQSEAHILNTASAAAFYASPEAAFGIYSVSKIAVRSISECLRWALRDENIGVTALCPGFVKSGIARTGRLHPAVLDGRREPDVAIETMVEGAMAALGMEPGQVASVAVDAVRRNLPYGITHPGFAVAAAEYASILGDAFDDATGPDDGGAREGGSVMEFIRWTEAQRYGVATEAAQGLPAAKLDV